METVGERVRLMRKQLNMSKWHSDLASARQHSQ